MSSYNWSTQNHPLPQEPPHTRPTIRRRDNPPEMQVTSKQMTEAFNNLNKVINKNPEKYGGQVDDECDCIFGKLIAIKLNKIPEHERDDVMFNIHALFRRRRERSPIESYRSSTPYNSFTPSNVSVKRPKLAKLVSPRPHASFSDPPIAHVTSDQSNEGQLYRHLYRTTKWRQFSSTLFIDTYYKRAATQTQSVSRRYKSKSQNTAVYSNAMVSPRPHSSSTGPPNAY